MAAAKLMTLQDRILQIDHIQARRFSKLSGDAVDIATEGIIRHLRACVRMEVNPDASAVREIIDDALNGRRVFAETLGPDVVLVAVGPDGDGHLFDAAVGHARQGLHGGQAEDAIADKLHEGQNAVGERMDDLREDSAERLEDLAESTHTLISKNPWTATACAFGVGLLVGFLLRRD